MHQNSIMGPLDLNSSIRWSSLVLLAALFVSGCRPVGPNYNRPPVDTPPAWREPPPDGWKTATPRDDIAKGNWWDVFDDAQLNALETQAIAANQNLKAAAERVIEARASAAVTRSNLFPFVGAAPSVGGGRTSGTRPSQPGTTDVAYTSARSACPLWRAIRWTSGARFAARSSPQMRSHKPAWRITRPFS